ncbi:hypothetical protein M422DRAFT_52127 [Sphaerobolus stellatus SS14]|uniref:Uncharacterized protein n=1 Tax=Sphaerobolus stellatus (strain SS14) TaxID=990650 RepID=A0A0C9UXV0_SPHS4|nr:hypothetical protein M422DRAFT_52127 [Sphaerobolus stellatus SS14]
MIASASFPRLIHLKIKVCRGVYLALIFTSRSLPSLESITLQGDIYELPLTANEKVALLHSLLKYHPTLSSLSLRGTTGDGHIWTPGCFDVPHATYSNLQTLTTESIIRPYLRMPGISTFLPISLAKQLTKLCTALDAKCFQLLSSMQTLQECIFVAGGDSVNNILHALPPSITRLLIMIREFYDYGEGYHARRYRWYRSRFNLVPINHLPNLTHFGGIITRDRLYQIEEHPTLKYVSFPPHYNRWILFQEAIEHQRNRIDIETQQTLSDVFPWYD